MRISGETSPAAVCAGVESTSQGISAASRSGHVSLADLIEVRGPYLALQDIASSEPGHVSARVWPEQLVDLELGEIAAAEAGRHMAILGSIASASSRADASRRSYFLAERAVLTSPDALSHVSGGGPLRLEARCTQSTTRHAQAACQIFGTDGRESFGLTVDYKLVPRKIFERLFAAHRVDMRRSSVRSDSDLGTAISLRRSPYRNRLGLEIVEVGQRSVHARLPSVPAEACAGHFPLYPAVPVAVLMEVFSNAGGALFRSLARAPELRYRVRSADISASKLVFAGTAIALRGELLEQDSRSVTMRMQASLVDGDEISSATFVLEREKSDGARP